MMRNKKNLILIILAGIVVLGSAGFLGSKILLAPKYEIIGNFHSHTLASDGEMSYYDLIDQARRLNFGFIAITDHDMISDLARELCPKEPEIICILGEEVSTKEGHIVALGITEEIPQGLSAQETIQRIHSQNGLAFPAHPESSNGLNADQIKELDFDAVECNARYKDEDGYSCRNIKGLPFVFNSDAHKKIELNDLANKCQVKDKNWEGLKKAIITGKCGEIIPN